MSKAPVPRQKVALAVAFVLVPHLRDDGARNPPAQAAYGKLPFCFEANQGQTDSRVRFLARGAGYSLFLTPSEAVLALRPRKTRARAAGPDVTTLEPDGADQTVLRLRLTGARPDSELVGLHELPTRTNYFIGNDPARWRTNIPSYAAVRYPEVYPGVDMLYHGQHGELEYDFVVAPGADPGAIRVAVEGADGIELNPVGDLVLHTRAGSIRQRRPVTYQEVGRTRRTIPSKYVRAGEKGFAFEVGSYDRSLPLVIDPGLVYSTYLGGSGWDEGWAIAIDGSRHAYVAGYTQSPNFPPPNAVQPGGLSGLDDAFVLKLDPAGTGLVYSTYLGGGGNEQAFGIAVDAQGAAYVTGYTTSTNFPTAGPTASAFAGVYDAFVTKLDPAGGALLLSRYLGGSGWETAWSIAVDAQGSPYVTGWTFSSNFPTSPPPILQSTYGGYGDAFVTKLEAATFGLAYSTYLGGNNGDSGNGIGVDAGGFAYVAGYTAATNFPVKVPALQATYAGAGDAFVAKLDRTGATLAYSTYLGGSGYDGARAIFVDRARRAYITGITESANFPTKLTAPAATAHGGGEDAFVAKLEASGASLVYSRYLGGSGLDRGHGIGVLDETFAYVTGETSSANFPMKKPVQGTLAGTYDAFVTRLDASGAGLVFSTYLGGGGYERGLGIAVEDRGGAAYLTGGTGSTNFPTAPSPPFQASMAGVSDGFATKITPAAADLSVTKSAPASAPRCVPLSYAITVTNNGPDDATKVGLSDTLPAGLNAATVGTTVGFCSSGPGTVDCDLSPLASGASATVTVVVLPSSVGPILNTATVTGREADLNPGNNTALATTLVWVSWWCWFFPCPSC